METKTKQFNDSVFFCESKLDSLNINPKMKKKDFFIFNNISPYII